VPSLTDVAKAIAQGGVDLSINGPIARLTLRHPARRNAMTRSMWRALRQHAVALSASDARCIVVAGAGGHFSAGGDISEYPEFRFQEASLRAFHEDDVAPALHTLLACDIPLVAQIEGNCIGGGLEIAACCDIRIAGDSATFGAPIAKLGMPMAPQELAIVLRAAGEASVREMLLEARLLPAQTMLLRGFVQRVVADADVAIEALATAQRVSSLGPQSARLNKQTMRDFWNKNEHFSDVDIDKLAIKNIVNELSSPYSYAASAEHMEGIEAFLAKRPPQF
jgi:enoyl-CoA hydratase